MNKTILMGGLTKSPEVKYLQNENHTAMAKQICLRDNRETLIPVTKMSEV